MCSLNHYTKPSSAVSEGDAHVYGGERGEYMYMIEGCIHVYGGGRRRTHTCIQWWGDAHMFMVMGGECTMNMVVGGGGCRYVYGGGRRCTHVYVQEYTPVYGSGRRRKMHTCLWLGSAHMYMVTGGRYPHVYST